MTPQQIREFFALNQTRPKKYLGQNFLVNPEALNIIIETGALTETDTVIEIGAGLGQLTKAVARYVERVIAIEIDALLYKTLVSQFSTNPRVHLLNADVLKLEFNSLLAPRTGSTLSNFKVTANLPYSITTPVLWKLLAHHKQIHSCVLMIQKEVAERIVAEPGGKTYGALTVGVAYRAEAACVATLSPENFYPVPKVDSALLKLTMRETPKVAVENEELFFKIVRTAFRARRKMLKNALVKSRFTSETGLAAAFEAVGIAPQQRAETLDINDFAALANFLARY